MQTSAELSHGLQEWAVTCRALGTGDITVLLRKGGIHERGGGLFQLEQQRFALMPTYLHQDATRLTAQYGGDYFDAVAQDPQPGCYHLTHWAEAVHIWRATDLMSVQNLGTELLWHADDIAMRFAYRKQPWVYVVAVRVYALQALVTIPDHASYAGCRSWLPLQRPLSAMTEAPVVDDVTHARRMAAIGDRLGCAGD